MTERDLPERIYCADLSGEGDLTWSTEPVERDGVTWAEYVRSVPSGEPIQSTEDMVQDAIESAAPVQGQAARDPDWEKCGRCGIRYPEVYWADDAQWAAVVGDTFAGLRCLACFCEEAQSAGLTPSFRILAPSLALRILREKGQLA